MCFIRGCNGRFAGLFNRITVLGEEMKLIKVEIYLEGEDGPREFKWREKQTLDVELGRNWLKVFMCVEGCTDTFIVPREKVSSMWMEQVPEGWKISGEKE